MKFILKYKPLWGIVKGRDVRLVLEGVEKEQMKYDERAQMSQTIIFFILRLELKSVIENCENPKDAWEAFKEHLLPDSKATHFLLCH